MNVINLPVSYPVKDMLIKSGKPIGGGGFGQVFLAEKPDVKNLYAVKVFYPRVLQLIENEEERENALKMVIRHFHEEIHIMVECKHPRLIPIEAYGILEDASGTSFPFIATPFFQQGSVENKVFKLEEAAAMIVTVCDVLGFLHERGIIHRDIKPGNLLLSDDNQIIVADLGVARILTGDEVQGGYTGFQSKGYSPYEQEEGINLSPATDIYAAAMTLYTLVTGKVHPHLQPIEKLPLAADHPRAPALLEVLKGATLFEMEKRAYQTAADFRNALHRVLSASVSGGPDNKDAKPEPVLTMPEFSKQKKTEPKKPNKKQKQPAARRAARRGFPALFFLLIIAGVIGYTQRHAFPGLYESLRRQTTMGNGDAAEAHFNKGKDFFDQSRFSEAAEAFEKAVSIKPQHAEAYAFLGWIYSELAQMNRSIEAWQKAAAHAPDSLGYSINLGKAFSRAGRSAEAVEIWKEILSRDPDNDIVSGLIEIEQHK